MSRPYIIAGPCSAESRDMILATAHELSALRVDAFRAGIWKPRTRPGSFEGVGVKGLEWLVEARASTGLPVGTEVACREHVEAVMDAGLDFVWIGARTTPNPFLVQEIAEALSGSRMKVWVKNPVSQDAGLWAGAVERLRSCGINDIGLIFRGFSSFEKVIGRNASQWLQAVQMRSSFPDIPMLCDPSHMAGRRALVPQMACRAMNLGMEGLMVESHCHPEAALSDSAQQLTPSALAELLDSLEVREADDNEVIEQLSIFRDRIDDIDEQILSLLASRMEVSREIGELKKAHSISIIQPERWEHVLAGAKTNAAMLGLSDELVEPLFSIIHDASVSEQK